jgi:tetratricopeptide (TPR) repeat protein
VTALAACGAVSLTPACAQQSISWELCRGDIKDTSVDLSIRACTEVIQSGRESPKNLAIAHLERGFWYARKKDQDRTLADFDEAIRLDPQNDTALGARSELHHSKGDLARAQADFEQAMRIDSIEGVRMANRCRSSFRVGFGQDGIDPARLEPVVWTCTKALWWSSMDCRSSSCRPEEPLETRAWIYLRLDKPDAAIADFDLALKHNPKLATALYGRGLAKRRIDRAAGAADFAAAKAIQPDVFEELASRLLFR